MSRMINDTPEYRAIWKGYVDGIIRRAKAAKDRELSPSEMRRRLRKGLPAKPAVLRP
jgi:hypothetical protein